MGWFGDLLVRGLIQDGTELLVFCLVLCVVGCFMYGYNESYQG